MSIKNNTTLLNSLLERVNALPDAGVELPELTNEGTAADLFSGKELIDSDGNKVTGTFSINNELSTQDDLITQIQAAVDNLPEAGEGGTIKTATVTLSSMFPTYSVCYMSPSGAQTATHKASPFTCVIPSIIYLQLGENATDYYYGNISYLYQNNDSLILNITGDGYINLSNSAGGVGGL